MTEGTAKLPRHGAAEARKIARKLLPLHNALGHLARRLDQKIDAVFAEHRQGLNLTRAQYVILLVAALSPGLEQGEISQFISYDAATVGLVVRRLEGKGLVRRTRSSRSNRGWMIEATPAGGAIIDDSMVALDEMQGELLGPLGPEERLLFLRLISKLVGVSNSYYSAAHEGSDGG
ncbi:MAG: MarR family transcriptional regulator [Sphingobium sp.]|nr:MarR family transcriptional regulator [Sphingobium sp.]